jgi:hypothetical protein
VSKLLGNLDLGGREIGGPALVGVVDRPRFDQIRQHLADEEGVAAGLGVKHAHEIVGALVESVPGGRLEQRGDPTLVESADADGRRAGVALEIGEQLGQRMVGGELRLAMGAEDERSERPLGADQVAQHQ